MELDKEVEMKQSMHKSSWSAKTLHALLTAGVVAAMLPGCGGSNSGDLARLEIPGGDASEVTPVELGNSLAGLDAADQATFTEGRIAFMTAEDPDEGLGPVFNGTSCGECHLSGAVGGAGFDLTLTRVTRIGGMKNGAYSDLEEFGGPVIQRRSIREMIANHPVAPEVVPPQARFVSERITTPLFGLGLIESIPDSTIIALAAKRHPDGVNGVINYVVNPINGKTEIGRYGWKSQISSLDVFSSDAYLNEMGITTPLFPSENMPQGQPMPAGADTVGDPEDQDDGPLFAQFIRFLAPPTRQNITSIVAQAGERVFDQIKCTSCHVPSLQTSASLSSALASKKVNLYSDLLIHRMGRGLADGVIQGEAKGDQWRTAPLWGLSRRVLFLHDGRSTTIEDAIMQHDGEGRASRDRFARLSAEDKAAVLQFLSGL
ncbi:MAG: di-heme oxidoredictase family protein [Fimbriimonas sp.]